MHLTYQSSNAHKRKTIRRRVTARESGRNWYRESRHTPAGNGAITTRELTGGYGAVFGTQ